MSDYAANANPLIDLTKMVAKQDGLSSVEWASIIVAGPIGLLSVKAIQHFFPVQASPEEQIRNMVTIIEAGSRAGAKKMKFRLSSNAGFSAAVGKMPFKIENQTDTTIDLEIEFAPHVPGMPPATA